MRRTVTVLLGFVVVSYALVVQQALLEGVLVGSLLVVAERLDAKGGVEGGFGLLRAVVAVCCAPLLAAYALLITQQFLVGPLALAAFLVARRVERSEAERRYHGAP